MVRRDLRREALFLCSTPFCTARSKLLIAAWTACSAASASPESIDRAAALRVVLVAVRALLFLAARFTAWRAIQSSGECLQGLSWACPGSLLHGGFKD